VVRALTTGAPRFRVQNTACAQGFSITLSAHPAVNGYPTLSAHPAVNGYPTLSAHPAINGYPTLSAHPAVNGYPTLFRAG